MYEIFILFLNDSQSERVRDILKQINNKNMKTNKFFTLLFAASLTLFACQNQDSSKSSDEGVIINAETNEISFSSTTDESLKLTYNFQKGLKVENSISINMEYEMMGQKMPATIVIDGTFEIIDVDAEGSADIKYAITGMKMDMAAQGIKFDSKNAADKDNPQVGPLFKIIDKNVITKIKNNGEVIGVDYSEIMSEMGTEFESLKSQFEQNVNQFSQSSFPLLAANAVKAGDTYQGAVVEQNMSGLQVKTETSYTVKSISKDKTKVILESNGSLVLNMDDAMMGAEMKMNEGSIKGWLLLDLARGLVAKSSLTSIMDFSTEAAGQKNDMIIKMDMIMNTK